MGAFKYEESSEADLEFLDAVELGPYEVIHIFILTYTIFYSFTTFFI